MLRFTLLELLIFLTPFAVFFGWRFLRTATGAEKAGAVERMDTPFGLLSLIGAVLVVATLVGFALYSDMRSDPLGRYEPPRLENGGVARGRVEPREGPVQDETQPGRQDPAPDEPGAA